MRQAVELGFRASTPHHVCMDHAILERFSRFDYDLQDVEFVRYFEARAGVQISWCPCGHDHIRDVVHSWVKLGFVPGQCGWEKKLAAYSLPPKPLEQRWQRILRGQIQDAWEVWLETREGPGTVLTGVTELVAPVVEREVLQLSLF
jgi:hypothetical protein